MTDVMTLHDALIAAGQEPAASYRCTYDNPVSGRQCGAVGPAWTFADTSGIPEIANLAICGGCYQDFKRLADAAADAAARAAVAGTWDSDEGSAVKADRNNRIAAWAWATQAGSPLSVACQDECALYVAALHRLTIDFATPADVVWPEEPMLEYAAPD